MKLLFLMLFLSLSGKEPSDSGILYRQLTWKDFKGKVPKDTELDIAAVTTCQFQFEWTTDGDYFTYSIKAYFLPYQSYVRQGSNEVLRHEQTHFKIAQIMALNCMRDLEPLQGGDHMTKKAADSIFLHYTAKRNAMNARLDSATARGLDKEVEKNWEYKISQELINLTDSSKIIHGRNSKNPKVSRPVHP